MEAKLLGFLVRYNIFSYTFRNFDADGLSLQRKLISKFINFSKLSVTLVFNLQIPILVIFMGLQCGILIHLVLVNLEKKFYNF